MSEDSPQKRRRENPVFSIRAALNKKVGKRVALRILLELVLLPFTIIGLLLEMVLMLAMAIGTMIGALVFMLIFVGIIVGVIGVFTIGLDGVLDKVSDGKFSLADITLTQERTVSSITVGDSSDLSTWTLASADGNSYPFSSEFTLEIEQTVQVIFPGGDDVTVEGYTLTSSEDERSLPFFEGSGVQLTRTLLISDFSSIEQVSTEEGTVFTFVPSNEDLPSVILHSGRSYMIGVSDGELRRIEVSGTSEALQPSSSDEQDGDD